MQELRRRKQIDWVLGKTQIVTAIAVVLFGAALKTNPERFAIVPWAKSSLEWMQDVAWIAVVTGPILVALLQACRRRFGNPWALDAVQKLLDEFQTELFVGLETDPSDEHRVTLFKHRRWLIRTIDPRNWTDWLVAVARSDHLTKRRIRKFRVPDDGERCEGVAGRAWRCKVWVIVPPPGEEALPLPTRKSAPQDVTKYAAATWVEELWVRKQLKRKRQLALSFAALQVLVKGRPWGVLVVDSRGQGTIDSDKLKKFQVYGRLLTPLLERI